MNTKYFVMETVKLKPGTGQNVKAVVVGMNNAVALIGNLIPTWFTSESSSRSG